MRGFYKELPQFENVPTYITTESYGGKMGAEFALLWDEVRDTGTIIKRKIKENNSIPRIPVSRNIDYKISTSVTKRKC
jgi:carboxypeptidase C (cathepsin A)